MADYLWSEKFSVGDPAIDEDHRDLFALIRELHETDGSLFNPSEIIDRLSEYAEHHFAREEALMREVGYPGYEQHLAEHNAFVDWIDSVKLAFRSTTASLMIGDLVDEFLVDWLTEHIMTEDMKYRDFIAGKNV